MKHHTRRRAATFIGGALVIALVWGATSAVGVATAGIDTGKAEARFSPASQQQGGDVTLTVTATQDPKVNGGTRADFNVGYDSRVLTFVRHDDPGACQAYPSTSEPPLKIDTTMYCDQTPGKQVKTDKFYFKVKQNAAVGRTTALAGASYGSASASAGLITLDITAAPGPIQGGTGGPIQGGDGGTVLNPGGSLGQTGSNTTNDVKGETDRLLFRDSLDLFVGKGSVNLYGPQLVWSTDGCSNPLLPEPTRSQPNGFDFRDACWRHDFGYRNYKKQGRFDEGARQKIDDNFLKDMNSVCGVYTGIDSWRGIICRNDARLYYQVVRGCGSSALPACASPILHNARFFAWNAAGRR